MINYSFSIRMAIFNIRGYVSHEIFLLLFHTAIICSFFYDDIKFLIVPFLL